MFWIPVLAHRWECSMLKYRRADACGTDGPPPWNWQDVIVLKPGEAFATAVEEKFKEGHFEEPAWAEYAPPYERMIVDAAKDAYKRQTGWMTRIHPLVLPSGRILLPLYSDGFNLSLSAISDDDGATWRASGPIVGIGPTQPTLLRKKDGSLVAYLRDSGNPPGRVQISTSQDDGDSWSLSQDTDIPNPDSSLEVIPLAGGAWVMVFNDTEDGRYRLTAALSDDEGATWKWRRSIESQDPGGDSFAYPSVIQTADGLIHATYSFASKEGECIRYCVFNEEWIKAGN
jgi:predicted neuraminidase